MKYAEFESLSDEKLVHRELDLEREMLELNFRKRMGQLEDTSKLAKVRKDIARARTAERLREREQGLNRDALRGLHMGSWTRGSGSASAASTEASTGGRRGFISGLVDRITGKE